MECASMFMEGGEWSSSNGVSFDHEMHFMANYLFSNNSNDSNLHSLSHGTSYSGGSDDLAYQSHENYFIDPDQIFGLNRSSVPVEFCLDTNGVVQVFPNLDESETYLSRHETIDHSTKHEIEEKSSDDSSEVGSKRSRNSEIQKPKRNTRSKKSRKHDSEEDERPNAKTRAERGTATDPQSLYARNRRHRINERLRTLQKLIPNGTKVDLSTMLEEAVTYVKFLQKQIKLLNSDDLWMYAPLAYNGMDIGLDSKLNSLL